MPVVVIPFAAVAYSMLSANASGFSADFTQELQHENIVALYDVQVSF